MVRRLLASRGDPSSGPGAHGRWRRSHLLRASVSHGIHVGARGVGGPGACRHALYPGVHKAHGVRRRLLPLTDLATSMAANSRRAGGRSLHCFHAGGCRQRLRAAQQVARWSLHGRVRGPAAGRQDSRHDGSVSSGSPGGVFTPTLPLAGSSTRLRPSGWRQP
jgi:hypothetical protein